MAKIVPDKKELEAIKAFVEKGEWPKPGTLPVCVRMPKRLS